MSPFSGPLHHHPVPADFRGDLHQPLQPRPLPRALPQGEEADRALRPGPGGHPLAGRCGVEQWLRRILRFEGGGAEIISVLVPSPLPEPGPAAGGGGGQLLGLGQALGEDEDKQRPSGGPRAWGPAGGGSEWGHYRANTDDRQGGLQIINKKKNLISIIKKNKLL